MLKYTEARVTFAEVPSEVTLCINISGCNIHCPDCHSKYLWEDVGTELTNEVLTNLILKNEGITAIAFMGGDSNPEEIYNFAKLIKESTNLKVCWYSGTSLRKDLPKELFDYVKTGPYIKEYGGLDSPTTNQRFYQILPKYAFNSDTVLYRYLEDITFKFWKGIKIDETRNSENDEE